MQTFRFLLAIILLSASALIAEDLVFTGTVVGVAPETGSLVLSSGPEAKLTFTGLREARIQTADGRIVPLAQLLPGMKVTVSYAAQGQSWIVSRVLIPAATGAVTASPVLPATADRKYRKLYDGDPTTNPGSKAAVDGDITTKPGNIADRDGDITTKGPDSANRDGDITTRKD